MLQERGLSLDEQNKGLLLRYDVEDRCNAFIANPIPRCVSRLVTCTLALLR